ncbi:hypothetical protein JTE90_004339 [Oedothorax gibbosus]|uniref:NADH dehydrogenase [ubiquinone] 1 alpha subcomplex subunit 11 n=1 Tax=Oedothorax gibbosus TaxID=931172 RepID=A0AAV6VMM8_9ARAC|nr:hypothetical protein JTE90_004339 [Oedothorax gibbosus]
MIDNTKFKDLLGLYDFYKYRDGEDCLPKTYYYTKYGAVFGSVVSVFEICCVSQPKTLFNIITRFGHFTLPMAGVGFVFGSTICLAAHIRKKDGVANHVIAGALAGAVYSIKYNKVYPGHAIGIGLAGLAGYMKYFHVQGWTIMDMRKQNTVRSFPLFDFSIKLYDDPGRPTRA